MPGHLQSLWTTLRRRNRLGWSLGVLVLVAAVGTWGYMRARSTRSAGLYVSVKRGHFEVSVTVTGELQSLRSVTISGPSVEMRSNSVRIGEVPIKDLVDEGTVVDSGDYVAQLDQQVLALQVKTLADEVEKGEQQYVKTQLDTALTLRELRSSLVNLEFEVEERRLACEQSKYEPPATLRQAQISLEKSERALRQAQENYRLKYRQLVASMREAELNLQRVKRQRDDLEALMGKFTIYAPQRGMVIYHREWDGKKRTVGSKISPWDATIATLPDLTELVSQTYVNEIDISRIRTGQSVSVGVDAFPDRSYLGRVSEVANVGEQVQGSDAKMFEVRVLLLAGDSVLRPSMTTSNRIVVYSSDDVVYCPLECVHASDSLQFVYTASGERRQVVLGESNESDAVVLRGLQEGEQLYLSIPPKGDAFRWVGLGSE